MISTEMIEQSKKKEFFFSDDNKPIIIPNSKGIIHEIGSSMLSQKMKNVDGVFFDFLSCCLKVDPNERITPEVFYS